jgi:hypothetical protein
VSLIPPAMTPSVNTDKWPVRFHIDADGELYPTYDVWISGFASTQQARMFAAEFLTGVDFDLQEESYDFDLREGETLYVRVLFDSAAAAFTFAQERFGPDVEVEVEELEYWPPPPPGQDCQPCMWLATAERLGYEVAESRYFGGQLHDLVLSWRPDSDRDLHALALEEGLTADQALAMFSGSPGAQWNRAEWLALYHEEPEPVGVQRWYSLNPEVMNYYAKGLRNPDAEAEPDEGVHVEIKE